MTSLEREDVVTAVTTLLPNKRHLVAWCSFSFKWKDSEELQGFLAVCKDLASKDGWTFSELVRQALVEYVKRHAPGNPQLVLGHWGPQPIPLPETLRNAHEHDWKTLRPGAWVCNVEGCREGWFEV
jgi:hypothetical protein